MSVSLNNTIYTFSDIIAFKYNDTSSVGPVQAGDSGSPLIVEYANGERKIIGIVFAGATGINGIGYACRIDKIVNLLQIKQWDVSGQNDLNTRKTLNSPSLLKIDINNSQFNTLKGQTQLTYNGKIYYQIGFTNNLYPKLP